MFPVAVIFIVYSLIIYLLRINSIKNRDTQNYIDIYGPIALVSILIISMICTIIFTYYHYNHQNNISNHLPEIDDGFYCQQILIPIIKPIFNQFSGIMYHNNTFFIVSSYKLIIYNILDNLIRFISIPNYDIEDITINPYQNNSVLLIAEDTLHNHFINVDYHNYNYSLIYTLSKKHTAESITYDNNTNSFYIGDDNGKITNIKFTDGDIIKYSNIDNKYINQYINITQKKISSLSYNRYSKYLFVIYVNEKKLVIWNIETGNFVNSWKLPGNSKQWEGIDTFYLDHSNYIIYLTKDTTTIMEI